MLGTTIFAIANISAKVAMCSYVNKMVLAATMAEYKLEFTHSVLNIITFTRTIGLAIKPS